MKIASFCMLLFCMHLSAATSSQTVSINVDSRSLKEVLKAVENQTGYMVIYTSQVEKVARPVTVKAERMPLTDFLKTVLDAQSMSYQINEKTIFVSVAANSPRKAGIVLTGQQEVVVRGVVSNANGAPFPGVNVRVKGTNNLVTTDNRGGYTIRFQGEVTLVFSYVGFQTEERIVRASGNLSVALQPQEDELDEIVVIGYGEVTRQDLTGSVAQVDMKDLAKAPVGSFSEALAGRVAGVQVSANEGQPGEELNIVIRGAGSLTQSTAPLYVIDGFPMEDFLASSMNPEEIESISILKDASATAIYGARASNGVVLIQTKKGKAGKPVITLNSSVGFQEVGNRLELMSPYEFVKYHSELKPEVTAGRYFQNGRTLESYRDMPAIDWQSLLFRRSPTAINNLAIRGGNAQTKYSVSGSAYNQEGVILNTGFTRYTGRVTVDQVITDKLDVGVTVNKSKLDAFGVQASSVSSTSNPTNFLFYNTWGYRPVAGRDDLDLESEEYDPETFSSSETRFNPVITAENIDRNYATDDFSAVGFLNYKILDELKLRITGNISERKFLSDLFYNSKTPQGSPDNINNLRGINGSVRYSARSTWSNENTLTYDKRFKRGHRLNVLGGFSLLSMNLRELGVAVQNLPNEQLGLSGFDEGTPYSSPAVSSAYTLASFFGRVRYNYYSRYILEAVIRGDGSSKFAPGSKWGYFPSASFTWNMKSESFLKEVSAVSSSKLRLSYGMTGNNRVSDFAYLSSLSFPITNSYSFNNAYPTKGMIANDLGNYRLKWESAEQIDIGYDLSLFNERVGLVVDLYQRTNHDLLLNAQLPLTTGFSTAFRNIGKLQNRGLEISLNTTNLQTKAFTWTSSFNISFNRNKILSLVENQKNQFSFITLATQYNTSPLYIAQVDQPAAMFFGYIFDGVYQYEDFDNPSPGVYMLKNSVSDNGDENPQPGDIKYRDLNGDGTVNSYDQTVIGGGVPLHVGGFGNNFSYKGFDLNVFFQWSYGNDIFNANRLLLEGNGLLRTDLNQLASYADRWSPENPTNRNYRANGQGPLGRFSSRTIEDGSYLRLKTVSLGYQLPQTAIRRIGLSGLRLNVSAQNLLTWTNYSGMDPEVSVRNSVLTPGFDYSAYPQARTLVFGLNATF